MKPKKHRILFPATAFCLLWTSVLVTGQERQGHAAHHHRYRFVDAGTFGGPVSYLANDPSGGGAAAGIMNRRGTVVSAADTSIPDPNDPNTCLLCPPDPFIFHAFRWDDGVLTDLGALPGVNSSFANWISDNGLVAGFSENGTIDPLLGVPAIDAVFWKNGEIMNLGTIEGGFESSASAVNTRGQVAGGVVNSVPDPFSPFGLQVRAFLWETGTMADLGTLGGPDATAFFVNERGQVAGSSYINSTPNPPIGFPPCNSLTGLPTQDPFFWEDGKMIDLGTLGGTCGAPNAFNNRGEVVGLSNVAGDQTFHPFLWTKAEGMKDLGTFGGSTGQANWVNDNGEVVGWATNPDDQELLAFLWKHGGLTELRPLQGEACSAALGINSKSQVVGLSAKICTFTAEDRQASLWEDGRVIDLNTFLPLRADLQQLTDAYNINDRGEIVGLGIPPGCGDEFSCGHVFILLPCEGERSDNEECRGDDAVGTKAAIQSRLGPTNRNATSAMESGLTPRDIAARMRAGFGQIRNFRATRPK